MRHQSKPSILFLCTGNACRSQMAEGWMRYFYADKFTIYSAGIKAHGQNPFAIEVMGEAGVDISQQASQTLEEIDIDSADYVVTVCDHAKENCPLFPAKIKRIHLGFEDPPKLAARQDTLEKKLDCYRKVRDQIKMTIATIDQEIN